jgi:hypothetical protein
MKTASPPPATPVRYAPSEHFIAISVRVAREKEAAMS